jgi:HEAT repeats
MKPSTKIAVLLGAVVVTGSISVWLCWPSWRQRAMVAPTPQTSRTNVPPPTTPVALATLGPAPSAPDTVPESVRPIVAAVPAGTFAERVKTVRALPADLTAQEIHAFYTYLLTPAQSGAENRQQENWLRNEMMDKLVEAPALPAGLARVLVAIYQDPTQDIVMRDYAVQHMMPVYARASAEEKATLQQTLWQAVEETDSSIAGTALLALRDLAQDHREFEQNQLGEAALKLAGDDRCGDLSRITALQLCGRMGMDQAAPLLLQLSQKAGSVPLQIAAIAALGDVGNAEAQNYLRQLASQPDPRLRPALETALKKMNGRL